MKSEFPSLIVCTKIVITLLAVIYLVYLVTGLFFSYLGPNPIEVITHKTGEWGLHFLLFSLAITPLRRHFHWNSLIKLRRLLGLWSFAFLSFHLFVFLFFDHFFDWVFIFEDIIERPYITVGVLGFLLMIPLAVTSLQSLQRRMGKAWIKLHRLVYVAACLGIIHYWWLVKSDILWPLVYLLALVVLLADRGYWHYRKWAYSRWRQREESLS